MNKFVKAICFNDELKHKWFSFDLEDIDYAKSQCNKCPVIKECGVALAKEEYPVGVRAGLSDYDRLILKWKEAKNTNESNWE